MGEDVSGDVPFKLFELKVTRRLDPNGD